MATQTLTAHTVPDSAVPLLLHPRRDTATTGSPETIAVALANEPVEQLEGLVRLVVVAEAPVIADDLRSAQPLEHGASLPVVAAVRVVAVANVDARLCQCARYGTPSAAVGPLVGTHPAVPSVC